MIAYFLLLMVCTITWFVTGTLWMNWIATGNNILQKKELNEHHEANVTALILVFILPVFLALVLPVVCAFVHPDTLPMGMLYFAVGVNFFLWFFLYKFIRPALIQTQSDDEAAPLNSENRHVQLNMLFTLLSIIWTYLLWKTLSV